MRFSRRWTHNHHHLLVALRPEHSSSCEIGVYGSPACAGTTACPLYAEMQVHGCRPNKNNVGGSHAKSFAIAGSPQPAENHRGAGGDLDDRAPGARPRV